MSDAVKLACVFHSWEERKNGWMAFKLEDGSTDHTIYPSKTAAIEHQSNEHYCFYLALRGCPAGMPERDAQVMLEYQRYCYDQGLPLIDPQSSLIFPVSRGGNSWLRK